MSKKEHIEITVSVADSHKDDLAAVASALKHQGFVLKESLREIGILIGSAPDSSIAKLSAVPGVSAIERQRNDYRTQQ